MFEAARSIMNWLGNCAKVVPDFSFCNSLSLYWSLFAFYVFYRHLTIKLKYEQVIASQNEPVRWTSPVGLPVVQPYRKLGDHSVSIGKLSIWRLFFFFFFFCVA